MEWETFKNKCDQVYYFNKKTGKNVGGVRAHEWMKED